MASYMPKCSECGYLGRMRQKAATKTSTGGPNKDAELLEVKPGERELTEGGGHRFFYPACFMGRSEITDRNEHGVRGHRLGRDHDCPKFTEYEPGYTPRRTQELRYQQRLEEREDQRDRDNKRHNRNMTIISVALATAVGLIVAFADKI